MANNKERSRLVVVVAVTILLSITPALSFVQPASSAPDTKSSQTSTSLNFFGKALQGAFANEENSTPQNAGLSNGPRYNDQVTVNGKKVPKAVVDQKVSIVCTAARVKVPYNCNNGDCGTCAVRINGRPARACVSKVPAGKCSIVTLWRVKIVAQHKAESVVNETPYYKIWCWRKEEGAMEDNIAMESLLSFSSPCKLSKHCTDCLRDQFSLKHCGL